MHIDKIKNKYSATMFWPAWFSNLLANDWWAHSQPSTLRELCIMTSHSKYTKLFFHLTQMNLSQVDHSAARDLENHFLGHQPRPPQ